jgi:hypothetical protein
MKPVQIDETFFFGRIVQTLSTVLFKLELDDSSRSGISLSKKQILLQQTKKMHHISLKKQYIYIEKKLFSKKCFIDISDLNRILIQHLGNVTEFF